MQRKISRRSIVKSGLIAGAILPVAGLVSRGATAAPLPPLDPSDPTAKALGFTNDGGKVDTKAYPTFKAGQKRSNCCQHQGKASGPATTWKVLPANDRPQGRR